MDIDSTRDGGAAVVDGGPTGGRDVDDQEVQGALVTHEGYGPGAHGDRGV